MSPGPYRVARATVDHLPGLVALWQAMGFSVQELEKRLTEFQVVQAPDGQLLGAVGLQIAERQARIHSEAFTDFALADQLRPLLWERIQALANNHGLVRIWTQEKAPFWSRNGLLPANAQALEKLPATWKDLPVDWLTIQLREEASPALSAEKEFELFMESERQRTKKTLHQARVLKFVATLIALALLLFAVAVGFYLFRKNPALLNR